MPRRAARLPLRGAPLPTYEYHCPKCKATYELRQGFDAETTQKCEECGKGTAKLVLHAPPVVFKGSGWYVTDSKGKSSATTESRSESKAESTDTSAAAEPTKKSAEPKPSTTPASSDAAAS